MRAKAVSAFVLSLFFIAQSVPLESTHSLYGKRQAIYWEEQEEEERERESVPMAFVGAENRRKASTHPYVPPSLKIRFCLVSSSASCSSVRMPV
uniref:Putative secreted protein n=1 Tax=Anopheles triannulatus TaxID=58253 RepID=A0A2M4B512_9DIPT